jgi:hypothetical protein
MRPFHNVANFRKDDIMGTSDVANQRGTNRTAITVGLCAFLAVAAYFLWTEHRAHVIAVMPWLLLLACPVIHLFMHRRHGRHEGHEHRQEGKR